MCNLQRKEQLKSGFALRKDKSLHFFIMNKYSSVIVLKCSALPLADSAKKLGIILVIDLAEVQAKKGTKLAGKERN